MAKPKIRFKGYTDDWEQRKLNEYFNVSTAKNKDNHYGKEDVLSVSGDYGIVNQIKFQGRSFAGATVANYGVVNTGDVVYTKSPLSTNPYGIIKANKGKAGIVSTLYAVYKPCKNVNSEFVQVYFELNSRMNNYMQPLVNKGAKNDMKVTAENALKGGVCFPKLNEQNAIVEYFRSLDHLITLHQRKCEETKKLKKYMLQKMFPQNGQTVPEIRFSGFTDAWEQRKLGEIATETYGGGTPKTSNEEFWKGDIPWIQSSDLIDECLFDVRPRKCISQEAVSKSATKLVPQNSIAIVTRVGVGKLAFMPFSYATSQDFLSLSGLKIDPEFTVYALYKMMQSVSNEVQGTSIKGVTKDELLAKKIIFPSCNEQKKIGAYLHNLDHLITLHQYKCEQLQSMKKFMLQNMFV